MVPRSLQKLSGDSKTFCVHNGFKDRFASGVVVTWEVVDSWVEAGGGIEGSTLMMRDLDRVKEPSLGFLLPRRLGILPVSSILDIVFLFSKVVGWDWGRTSPSIWMTSSLARPFPLFSFVVAIPIQEKEREDCQSLDKLNKNEQAKVQKT